MKHSKTRLHVAKLVLLLPLALYLVFIVAERRGVWDRLFGLDLDEQIAERFDRSVGPDDAVPVRAEDKEFIPLIKLIKAYSGVELAKDKTPQVVVRYQAKVYDAQPIGDGKLAQWSSPVTPIAVMYYDWPNVSFPGGTVPHDEYTVVGTLGALHEWIARSREDFHFWVVDLILVGLVPILLGVYEFYVETIYERDSTIFGETSDLQVGSRVQILTPIPGRPRAEWPLGEEVYVVREVDKGKNKAMATPVFPALSGPIPTVSGPMEGPLSPFVKANTPS